MCWAQLPYQATLKMPSAPWDWNPEEISPKTPEINHPKLGKDASPMVLVEMLQAVIHTLDLA